MNQKILILHGPLESYGINPAISLFTPDWREHDKYRKTFHCGQNILAMAVAFKKFGYKIIYSGWQDDEVWLTQNKDFFDGICLSDQENKSQEINFYGQKVINNKLKLYWLSLKGLELAQKQFPDSSFVFKLRSDVAINPSILNQDIVKIANLDQTILIESADRGNVAYVPDFMMGGTIINLVNIFKHLVEVNVENRPYHISSHVEHAIAVLKFKEMGLYSRICCLSQSLYESVVWRGVPRYLEYAVNSIPNHLLFDCEIIFPETVTSSSISGTST
jgi:hypothetical protein